MEPTRLVIDIPAIPLTEALLVLIACLLYRACNLLSEIARSNKQLVQRSEVHAGEPEARQRRPTPQPLADGRAGSSSSDLERLRPIMVSAEAFEKCLLGEDDVQVPLFMAACKCYCNVLNVIGPFTLITVREVHANMAKIDTSLQLDAVAYRSMRALLTAEVDAGMHQEGAILANPSAAMGLLWARRGLSFWVEVYRSLLPEGYLDAYLPASKQGAEGAEQAGDAALCLTPTPSLEGCPSPSGPGAEASAQAGGRRASCPSPAPRSAGGAGGGVSSGSSFKEVILDAYMRTCQPYNGFLTRRSFDFTLGVVPAWPEVATKLAPTEALLNEDMARWVAALDRLLPAMERLHKALDLEDQRKSL